MKITYVLPHSPESCGLVDETFVNFNHFSHTYCEFMDKLGHKTELLYLGKGKEIKRLKNNKTQFPIFIGKSFGKEYSLPLIKYMFQVNSDVVHIHGYRQLNILPILTILTLRKIPIVVQHHGGAYNYSKLKVKLYYKILKYLLSVPDIILAVNINEISNLKKTGIEEKKIKHIPVGVDTSIFYPESKEESRKKLNLPQNKKYILFVGRMVKLKGTEYLIKSIPSIKQIYPDLMLILIGGGPELNRLKALCKVEGLEKNVNFLGYINEPETIRTYYNATDICVFPSLAEGFPIVTLEALACMKPVVGTKAHSLLVNEENALIAKTKSPESIAENISILLSNEELAKKLSINGYNYTVNNFSWEKVAEKLDEVYSNLTLKVR